MAKVPLVDLTVTEFVGELGSKHPVPGGGGASALVGALASALSQMVANLTLGKTKYADVEDEVNTLKIYAYRLEKDLLECITRDAAVFEPLAGAYRMPKNTEEEIESKNRVMEAALKEASLVPLEIMRTVARVIETTGKLAEKGSKLAISDAGCAAVLAAGALRSAWLNVTVNTKLIKDEAFAARVNEEGEALLEKYLPLADAIYENVSGEFIR
jgi:formiminotetrahydrofolate cyclodeaminase